MSLRYDDYLRMRMTNEDRIPIDADLELVASRQGWDPWRMK